MRGMMGDDKNSKLQIFNKVSKRGFSIPLDFTVWGLQFFGGECRFANACKPRQSLV